MDNIQNSSHHLPKRLPPIPANRRRRWVSSKFEVEWVKIQPQTLPLQPVAPGTSFNNLSSEWKFTQVTSLEGHNISSGPAKVLYPTPILPPLDTDPLQLKISSSGLLVFIPKSATVGDLMQVLSRGYGIGIHSFYVEVETESGKQNFYSYCDLDKPILASEIINNSLVEPHVYFQRLQINTTNRSVEFFPLSGTVGELKDRVRNLMEWGPSFDFNLSHAGNLLDSDSALITFYGIKEDGMLLVKH